MLRTGLFVIILTLIASELAGQELSQDLTRLPRRKAATANGWAGKVRR